LWQREREREREREMAAIVGVPSLCTAGVAAEKAVGAASGALAGERVRVKARAGCGCAGKLGLQVAAQKGQGEKPWDTQRALFPASESATETSAVATDFVVAEKGRRGSFGYSRGTESEDEDSDLDAAEVLRVDNDAVADGDELAISRLGISEAVVEALAKRGISQLFPIQVPIFSQTQHHSVPQLSQHVFSQ
jgi:ATP-dependent RNA helicase DDX21